MKHELHRSRRARSCAGLLALASGALACSGEYPLGSMERHEQLLDGEEATSASSSPQAGVDSALQGVLAPPGLTVGLDSVSSFGPGFVAALGDVDGDGYDDSAVSMMDRATTVSYVQLRYGGPQPQTPVDAFQFAQSGARLLWADGRSPLGDAIVTAAGDVDGDGYADVLVKSYECDQTLAAEGAYLLYGGPERLSGTLPLSSVAARFLPPERGANQPYGGCISRVAGVPGDLDGDGFDDFVLSVTSLVHSTGEPEFGRGEGAYLFYGRAARFVGETPYASADAHLRATQDLQVHPVGDISGDGRAELMLASGYYDGVFPTNGIFVVPGSDERLSGVVDLNGTATLPDANVAANAPAVPGGFDLDGDGTNDVLLSDDQGRQYLFYGGPELIAGGLQLTQADATFAQQDFLYMAPAGDRDGDGDDELLSVFPLDSTWFMDVALLDGQGSRAAGGVSFPQAAVRAAHPDGPFEDRLRGVQFAFPAGDLDGNGASDVFTISALRTTEAGGAYALSAFQLHVHYGALAFAAAPPLR